MSLLLMALSAGLILAQWQTRLYPREAAYALVAALACALPFGWELLRAGPFGRAARLRATLLAWLACLLLGFAWSSWQAQRALDARLPADAFGQTASWRVWLDDLPLQGSGGTRLHLRTLGSGQEFSVLYPDRQGRPPPALHAGDCQDMQLRLQPVHGPLNFAGFDLEAWMFANRVIASGSVLNALPCPPQSRPWLMALQAWRDQIRASLEQTLQSHPARGILVALAVGDQSQIPQAQWDVLWRSGVGHLVSISGVHVTLLAGVLRQLLEFLWRRSRRACMIYPAPLAGALLSLLAASVYALLAGFAIPTRRTLYMLLAGWVASALEWQPGPGRIFWLALVLTLWTDPLAALQPSFFLSFAAVGTLIWADHGRQADRATPGWRDACRAHWVATLALLPLVAWYFGQVSVVGPLANVVAIPLVSLLITPLTLASMFPGLHLLAVPAAWLCGRLLDLLGWLAQPSWACLQLPEPACTSLLLALLATALLLQTPFAGQYLALLGLLPLLCPLPALPREGEAWIEMIDVGQGLSVLLRTRSHTLLFDTGPRWPGGDAGERTLLPLLRAEGVRQLDRLVLSHPDADHVGGAHSLLRGLPVGAVLSGFERPGAQPCLRGTQWDWDGIRLEFLYPPATPIPGSRGRAHQRNDHACVLRVARAGHAVLLPADIEAPAETDLLQQPQASTALRADAIVVAHHGSHTSSSAEWIAAVQPQWALISCGWHNHFHHPAPEVVARWQANGARVLRTDLDGAVRLTLDAQGVQMVTAREQRAAWWRVASDAR